MKLSHLGAVAFPDTDFGSAGMVEETLMQMRIETKKKKTKPLNSRSEGGHICLKILSLKILQVPLSIFSVEYKS